MCGKFKPFRRQKENFPNNSLCTVTTKNMKNVILHFHHPIERRQGEGVGEVVAQFHFCQSRFSEIQFCFRFI